MPAADDGAALGLLPSAGCRRVTLSAGECAHDEIRAVKPEAPNRDTSRVVASWSQSTTA
jgi:hypothetical protein